MTNKKTPYMSYWSKINTRNNWLKQHGIAMNRKRPFYKSQKRKRLCFLHLHLDEYYLLFNKSTIETMSLVYTQKRKNRVAPLVVTQSIVKQEMDSFLLRKELNMNIK